MENVVDKKELIDWIQDCDNKEVLLKIQLLKKETEPFDFDTEFEKGLSSLEFKEKTTEFLKSLPWKK